MKYRDIPILYVLGTGRYGATMLMNVLNQSPDLKVLKGEFNEVFHPPSFTYNPKMFPKLRHIFFDLEQFSKYLLFELYNFQKKIEKYSKRRSLEDIDYAILNKLEHNYKSLNDHYK